MMKIPIFILLSFYLSSAMSQLFNEKLRLLEHENKGCPLNSQCSKENGLKFLEWSKSLKIYDKEQQYRELKKFFKKNGIPVDFLAKESLIEENDIVLLNSKCRHHNPKNSLRKIVKGTYFTKNISFEKDGFNFDTINVFEQKKLTAYPTSYGDLPIFIKDNRLFYLKDYEDFLYQVSIGVKGDIQLENLPGSLYAKAQSKKVKDFKCPENKTEHSSLYTSSYCQKIWDIDSNTLKTIQVFWSCP